MMKKINLHICLRGQHFLESQDNIEYMIERFEATKEDWLCLSYNILYASNNFEKNPTLSEHRDLVKRVKASFNQVKAFEFESNFFNSNVPFKRCTPSANVIIAESTYNFVELNDIDNEDYLLSCRSDYYLTDEFIKMVCSRQFFDNLNSREEEYRFFESKVYIPMIGKKRLLDMCDYHYLAKVSDLKSFSLIDYDEACEMWGDPLFQQDFKMFVEKIEFIKPMQDVFKSKKITHVNDEYWKIINNNFLYGGYAKDTVATLSFSRRNSAVGKGRSNMKCSKNISHAEVIKYHKIVEKYGKLKASGIVVNRMSDSFGGFK